MARRASPLSFLVVVLLMAVAFSALRRHLPAGGAAPATDTGLPCWESAEGCPDDQALVEGPGRRPADVVLAAVDVCRDVGYLCADVERDGSLRLLRWPDGTRELRVLVPLPDEPDRTYARALQRAAVRGIQAWQGKPFALRIETRERGTPDIRVSWTTSLGNNQLGLTRTRWQAQGDRITFSVPGLYLATRSPSNPSRRLDARQVALTAAHEMGHALGLPHSDRPSDVMYPTNTANALSARDYRTMEAVYRLPNGAEIRRDAPETGRR
ncbi:MAG: hypothetical protein D6701_02830 [Gemmatimonadetes bacterium]|nr:MAG: hypothetical protein D6701_02830 [Gemmatimonadota bacterium]